MTVMVFHSIEQMSKLFNIIKFHEYRNLCFSDDLGILCRRQYSIFQMSSEQIKHDTYIMVT